MKSIIKKKVIKKKVRKTRRRMIVKHHQILQESDDITRIEGF